MKNMFESSEVFTAHATIAAGYYMLQELYKEMNVPIDNISKMIDDATGFGKAKFKEHIESGIAIMLDIVEAKESIGADVTKDKEILNKFFKESQKNEQ